MGLKRFSDTGNKVIFPNSFLAVYLKDLKNKQNMKHYSGKNKHLLFIFSILGSQGLGWAGFNITHSNHGNVGESSSNYSSISQE